MDDVYHLISVFFSLVTLYYSFKVKKIFGRIYLRSFTFVTLAIILLSLSHLVELFNLEYPFGVMLEHFFFSTGMISLMISFIVLMKSLENK